MVGLFSIDNVMPPFAEVEMTQCLPGQKNTDTGGQGGDVVEEDPAEDWPNNFDIELWGSRGIGIGMFIVVWVVIEEAPAIGTTGSPDALEEFIPDDDAAGEGDIKRAGLLGARPPRVKLMTQ